MWVCEDCGTENPKEEAYCEKCQSPRPTSSLLGTQISQWVLERELGEGGMAVVFLGRHVRLKSAVAIKLLRAEINHKKDVIERFRNEALAASHLQHENLIKVLDFGFQRDIGFYMVMEFLEGIDLEDKMLESPFPTPWILGVGRQIAAGLRAAHDAGIIHRDLKPSNIYLVPRPDSDVPLVKILDFGIAKIQETTISELDQDQKLTKTGAVLGTPFYLAPEQLRRRPGQEITAQVDVYAFGVILYQMFTGELPIEEPTVAEQMVSILMVEPPMAGSIQPALDGTALEIGLHRLLAKSPDDRPLTANDAWEEIEKAAEVLEDGDKDAILRQHWETEFRSLLVGDERSWFMRWGWVAALLLLFGAGGIAIVYLWQQKPETKTIVKTKTIRVKEKLSELPKLQNLGTLAFKKKEYLKAIASWRKVVGSEKWKPSAKFYNPKLHKFLGYALIEKKRFHAGLREYETYLKNTKLEGKELTSLKVYIGKLRERVREQRDLLRQPYNRLVAMLKARRYKKAKEAYGLLFRLDPSMPDSYLRAAKALTPQFPQWSLSLYRKLMGEDFSKEERGQASMLRKLLAGKVKAKRERRFQALDQAIEKRSKSQSRRVIRRMIREQGGDPLLHQALATRIKRLAKTNTTLAKTLLDTYKKEVALMQKRKAWSWQSPFVAKALPNWDTLKSVLLLADRFAKATKQHDRAQNALERGSLSSSLRIFRKVETMWKELSGKDSLWKENATLKQKQARQQIERLEKLNKQWLLILRSFRLYQYKSAQESYTSFEKELAAYPKAQRRYKRQILALNDKVLKGRRALQKADRLYRNEKYMDAIKGYKVYQKLFPESRLKKYVSKRLFLSFCYGPAPWKPGCPPQRRKR